MVAAVLAYPSLTTFTKQAATERLQRVVMPLLLVVQSKRLNRAVMFR